jgi:hypothetical protein
VVFILGAGASVPLGMPTTVGLRKGLCDDTPEGRAARRKSRKSEVPEFKNERKPPP